MPRPRRPPDACPARRCSRAARRSPPDLNPRRGLTRARSRLASTPASSSSVHRCRRIPGALAQDPSRPNASQKARGHRRNARRARVCRSDEEPLADGARNASSWNPLNSGRDGAQRFAQLPWLPRRARARCSPSSPGRCPPPPRREATPSSSTGCWRTRGGSCPSSTCTSGSPCSSVDLVRESDAARRNRLDRRHDDHGVARGACTRLACEIRRRLGVVLHGELTEMTRVCGPARDVSRWASHVSCDVITSARSSTNPSNRHLFIGAWLRPSNPGLLRFFSRFSMRFSTLALARFLRSPCVFSVSPPSAPRCSPRAPPTSPRTSSSSSARS